MTKNLILWLVIAVVLMAVFQNLSTEPPADEIPYSEFREDLDNGRVDSIVNEGRSIYGQTTDGQKFVTTIPTLGDRSLMDDLREKDVQVEGAEDKQMSFWMQLFVSAFPIPDHLQIHDTARLRWVAGSRD